MVAGLLLVVAYGIYALGSHAPAPDDLKSWAIALLVFIGIGVVAIIVIQILFHIAFAIGIAVKERTRDEKTVERMVSATFVEDERDKLINLKASRAGSLCAGVGLIAALVVLALGLAEVVALHVLVGAFAFATIPEGVMNVYLNERGV
jgi:hypothetical protein